MSRVSLCLLFLLTSLNLKGQQISMSFGVFTGITGSHTSDKGIKADPRYEAKYEAKFAPIGINVGIDYEGIGVMISPGLINVGQNFYVINTVGGQEGLRKIDLQYLNVPVSLKVHLVKLYFLKISAVASIGTAFLMSGKEDISHNSSKLQFPTEIYAILPPNYTIEYDGVLVPEINRYSISQKKDFRSLQLFAGAGFRTDWDASNNWRVSLDIRLNYGIFDPRTPTYARHLESNVRLYERPGDRKDIFAQLTIGISRYVEFEKRDKERKKKLKGSSTKYKPTKYPGQRTRVSKPKG